MLEVLNPVKISCLSMRHDSFSEPDGPGNNALEPIGSG
jgi:hypothetical protein